MASILGIDYGVRRIGTAIADAEIRIATPLVVVAGRGEATRDAGKIIDLARRQGAEAFVVGLPLNMDGTDSEQTAMTRRFAAELARLSKAPVHLQDERLTSFTAEGVLHDAGVSPRKRRQLTDMVAAQKILQAYLDQPPPPM